MNTNTITKSSAKRKFCPTFCKLSSRFPITKIYLSDYKLTLFRCLKFICHHKTFQHPSVTTNTKQGINSKQCSNVDGGIRATSHVFHNAAGPLLLPNDCCVLNQRHDSCVLNQRRSLREHLKRDEELIDFNKVEFGITNAICIGLRPIF